MPQLTSLHQKLIDSMDLPGEPGDRRVVVAMSGGVDSSVTAALLHEIGYEVIGITLQLYDHGQALQKKGACCAGQDIHDAKMIAQKCGFAHYVLDYENRFKQAVIDEFADSYLVGATPIPCIRCNERVKFADLLSTAKELGANCLATGHYIRREQKNGLAQLHQAVDNHRDQSYFLFSTTREQLAFLRFPLGALPKAEVRKQAERLGLTVAQKPDSQDICFVPQGSYADLVTKLRPGTAQPGDIVTSKGKKIGEHQGVIHFTVGQRRGIGIGGGEPWYVIRLDANKQQVIVGRKEELGRQHVHLQDVNWLGQESLPEACANEREIEVKLRSAQPRRPAQLAFGGDGNVEIKLARPDDAIAPGQACVFYEPGASQLLGGGWITAAR